MLTIMLSAVQIYGKQKGQPDVYPGKHHLKPYFAIVKLRPEDALPMPLLLLADETIEAIERYIYQCDVYVAAGDDGLSAGVFALYRSSAEEIELKNMAVAEAYQGRGLGSYMLEEVCRIAASSGYIKVIVGTATVGRQLNFYKKNGFMPFDVRKDFFLTYYSEPIFEEGERLRDMILLEKYV